MRVERMTTGAHRLPMSRPWAPDADCMYLVTVELRAVDGTRGHGFSWTPQIGALAIGAMLEHCRPLVEGADVAPEATWDRLWSHLREAGAGGITTLAMAAVDVALWDLRAKAAGLSLVDLIGRRRRRAPVYASGVNRHYPLDELVEQAHRWVAAGHTRMKIKVGRPDLAEDVERVAAVREVIGPDRALMVDANQLWDLPTARRAVRELERFDLSWLEEPLPADDVAGYARLRSAVDVPIATGESLYNEYQFRDVLVAGAADYVQPNVIRVGGITPFLRVAWMARTFDVPTAPHLLPDLSAQLALCLPLPALVEDVEAASLDALGALSAPSGVTLAGGEAWADTPPGHGLVFATDLPPAGRPSPPESQNGAA